MMGDWGTGSVNAAAHLGQFPWKSKTLNHTFYNV